MTRTPRRLCVPGGDESARIASRLLASLPAATFELETFARLAGVVASRKIPTAAVECIQRPRLLVNPDFVARYCKRDEHLFLLVMHELWHVLLAHTSLYPRVTVAQNIAFDAIINAGLMRQFHKPEYMGFFEALNPSDQFPHLLLRPPVGWPDAPIYPEHLEPESARRILIQLYPPSGVPTPPLPFYKEILDLIRQHILDNGSIEIFVPGAPTLLGDHDTDGKGALANEFFRDVMSRVVEKWPAVPYGFGWRGAGGDVKHWQTYLGLTGDSPRRAFARVLRRTLGNQRGSNTRRTRTPFPGMTGASPLPNARDRLMPARKALGAPDTLWSQPGEVKARIPQRKYKSHVYLDVSGSMSQVIPQLLSLLLPFMAGGDVDVFQFSTVVEPLKFADVRDGIIQTTGGTDIDCVMAHLLKVEPPIRRVLILTDGYTGAPTDEQVSALKERHTRVYVVLPDESPYRDDLQTIATAFTVLPPA